MDTKSSGVNTQIVDVIEITESTPLITASTKFGKNVEWEFAEPGTYTNIESAAIDPNFQIELDKHKAHRLSEWPATAICGNDITSSCLYVAGLTAVSAGKFAPISLTIVAFVLYLFRDIYTEAVTALPLNGGSYNLLLNTTTKFVASIAACLTLLSYVATAVVSGSEAMDYLHDMVHEANPLWTTIICLGFFALLTFIGVGESSIVALIIFLMHLATLVLLIVFCSIRAFETKWEYLFQNWDLPPIRSVPLDIFFGFCSALLGVSGFETSANFVEEQADGVFPKTLRNMWFAVAFFNPVISLLSISVMPMEQIVAKSSTLLSEMGRVSGGKWLAILAGRPIFSYSQLKVNVDATLVLAGAVLTSFVGVNGLITRMSLDRIMPHFFLQRNPLRNTTHWIILTFFFLTSSLYLLVNNNVSTLAGVYTVSFLSVMALFAVGNMLLKYKRGKLPRATTAPWIFVVLGWAFVVTALVGNIIYDLNVLKYFAIYFSAVLLLVFVMIGRVRILRMFHFFLKDGCCARCAKNTLETTINEIRDMEMVFFAREGDLRTLNKAVQYVIDNELTRKLTIVHVYDRIENIPSKLRNNVAVLDEMYPKLRIDLITVKGEFNPAMVDYLAKELRVPKNFMFMACPNSRFPHNIGDFGGIRLITH